MSIFETQYLSSGGNRHSSAADWSQGAGLLAFASDQNVALWEPLDESRAGVLCLLNGHTAKVKAVKFSPTSPVDPQDQILITGSADGEIRVWRVSTVSRSWHCTAVIQAHEGSINAIAIKSNSVFFATAGADTAIKLWKLQAGGPSLVHTVLLKPRHIALSLVLSDFREAQTQVPDCFFLIVGGTRTSIQVYAISHLNSSPQHALQATLLGHEGWIQSLALRLDSETLGGDLLLASASQDKYVRLWRIHRSGSVATSKSTGQANDTTIFEHILTSKVQTIEIPTGNYSITFEALLLGHEDWIYTAAWSPRKDNLQLLTVSADNSLTIWEPDQHSGIWVSITRLGEISGQKGATTATGSTGGFWVGLWSPNGKAVACLGRTGSWKLWEFDESSVYWVQKTGVSGHVGSVNDLSWEGRGRYLLSTGSDQTTRLHAEWRRNSKGTWHEFSRPQIHGYDLNCVKSIGLQQFVSGADEKPLRVFDEPKAVASMMEHLCHIDTPALESLPNTAQMPVLGLSNKAADETEDLDETGDEGEHVIQNAKSSSFLEVLRSLNQPPPEDILARHTLWPEMEKLYGHGYEISSMACTENGAVLATACKASSIDHAVIRLYNTSDWQEIKPPLRAHSLTVTSLRFSSSPDRYLLSVGRDRQWTLFEQDGTDLQQWSFVSSNPKAHSRMVLDAAWSPRGGTPLFATAGRDKTVKIWSIERERRPGTGISQHKGVMCKSTVLRKQPVTALDFVSGSNEDLVCLAVGEEDGHISLHVFDSLNLVFVKTIELHVEICPSKTVTRLAWRPRSWRDESAANADHLAVASADSSVRIIQIRWEDDTVHNLNGGFHLDVVANAT